MTTLRLYNRRIMVPFPTGAKAFHVLQNIHTGSATIPDSSSGGIGTVFEGKAFEA
jgi:hypothetical protein